MSSKMCLGVDPDLGSGASFDDFKEAVVRHQELILRVISNIDSVKINLGFFLGHGSKGIALLEGLCERLNPQVPVILDAKWGEVPNTLKEYLRFAFEILKVPRLTLNPFFGESNLQLCVNEAVSHFGANARIYALCATSVGGSAELGVFQNQWRHVLAACQQESQRLIKKDPEWARVVGLVIGANRPEQLLSQELKETHLSVLAPGLGPQGASASVVDQASALNNEFTFPLQRLIFEGGRISVEKMLQNFENAQKMFSPLTA